MIIQTIDLNKIKLGSNVRLDIKDDDLSSLMRSIKNIGLLQPPGVKLDKDGKTFKVIYGNRRIASFKKLGLKEIPCVIHPTIESFPLEEISKHLSENTERLDLTTYELGIAYKRLMDEEKLTPREISARCNQPLSQVKVCLSLVSSGLGEDFVKRVSNSGPGIKRKPGMVPAPLAMALVNAQKVGKISMAQAQDIFEVAAKSPRHVSSNIKTYLTAARANKPFESISEDDGIYTTAVNIAITTKEKRRLTKKYITPGVYTNINKIARAILTGEISEKIKLETISHV